MIAAYGHAHLRNPAEPHSQEVASQLSHNLSMQLATMETNLDFNKELKLKLGKKTHSLQ